MLEKNHLFLSLFFLLQISSLYSQTSLNGIVTNQKEEPLPFVNILINDSPIEGVISDIDGKFEINIDDKLTSLTMSYVGYEMKRISLQDIDNQEFLNIQMKSIFYEFDEIVVRAGENPAHRIIRKVIENRDR